MNDPIPIYSYFFHQFIPAAAAPPVLACAGDSGHNTYENSTSVILSSAPRDVAESYE